MSLMSSFATIASIAGMRGRIPLVVSGDLHAVALGQILRSGQTKLDAHPITAVLAGPIGTRPGGWPSAVRGVAATPPAHLDVREEVKPIEQHGFTLADFLTDRIALRFFKWDVNTQSPESIASRLCPAHHGRPRRIRYYGTSRAPHRGRPSFLQR